MLKSFCFVELGKPLLSKSPPQQWFTWKNTETRIGGIALQPLNLVQQYLTCLFLLNNSELQGQIRILVRGGPSRVWTPGGRLLAHNLLKIGGFPLKMPENCMMLKKSCLQGDGSPGSASVEKINMDQSVIWVVMICSFLYTCTLSVLRAKAAKSTYSTQEFGSDQWMEPNMVRSSQIEMQENGGSKQSLMDQNKEVFVCVALVWSRIFFLHVFFFFFWSFEQLVTPQVVWTQKYETWTWIVQKTNPVQLTPKLRNWMD